MSLYRNIEEFLKPSDVKAVWFFTWTQLYLFIGGLITGVLLGGIFSVGGLGNLILTAGCGAVGYALGAIRLENVPLHQVAAALLRYFVRRLGGWDRVVCASDLWPETSFGESSPSAGISIVGPEGPLFQVGDEAGTQHLNLIRFDT